MTRSLTLGCNDGSQLVQLAPAFREPVLKVDLRRLGFDDHVSLESIAEPDHQFFIENQRLGRKFTVS